jgi:hypothetical protein
MRRILYSIIALATLVAVPALARAQVYVSAPSISVGIAPPAARFEVRPMAPSAAHVWTPGYWGWRGGAHVWVGGRYALPPAAGYGWLPARWERDAFGRWIFREGHWSMGAQRVDYGYYDAAPAASAYVNVAPPAPIVEARPIMPYAGAVWMPGYWNWNGYRHVWIGGRWSAPRPGWSFAPHAWHHTPRGWVHGGGHWYR